MHMQNAVSIVTLSLIIVLSPGGVSAQPATQRGLEEARAEVERLKQELDLLRREYGERLAALELQLATLESEHPEAVTAAAPQAEPPVEAPVPPGASGAGAPTGALPVYGPATGSKVFNPDIGVIGNFIGATGESQGGSPAIAPLPSLTLQESEVSLQAIIDPYARADFFLAISEEGIEVEEGYVTFPALPGRLLVKAGRMRANFGRLNTFHNHTLPWIDRPIVMFNLLGGSTEDPDTGIKDVGLSVNRLIPAGKIFIEATGEIFRGESGTLFQPSRRRDVSVVGRLRGFADLTENSSVDMGFSYTRGRNDLGSNFRTELYGADFTFRWRPLRRAIYRSFSAHSELIWSRREDVLGGQAAFGTFISAEYQLSRRWFTGARFDWSERARDASIRDRGVSGVLTYWPSEFSQIRTQYRRTRYGSAEPANEFLFQLLFTIGAHGAHAF